MDDIKRNKAQEQVFLARMISDFNLYTAEEVHKFGLKNEEFITPDNKFSLKYVAPYERKGRKDKNSDGNDKPRVKVSGFFRKVISLSDHRELYGINSSLYKAEHKIHQTESEWHAAWKERVKDFCELEKRFYYNNVAVKKGYKIADAYYSETDTVIEFQKSFSDEALNKSEFYKKEGKKLIWLFYLPTLGVFEDENLYKIREDNFYHFFRIEDLVPNFYEDNIVFIQDKHEKIYLVKRLNRISSNDELDATVRCFDTDLVFENSNEFVYWLKFEWIKSSYFNKNNNLIELKSIEEILEPFFCSNDKMIYLQNATKNDINGYPLIYCFVKDETGFRTNQYGYISYRCYINNVGYYSVNSKWEHTNHNQRNKKWVLLATDNKKYSDLLILDAPKEKE